MTVNILAVGDVVGQTGLNILKERLKPLQWIGIVIGIVAMCMLGI